MGLMDWQGREGKEGENGEQEDKALLAVEGRTERLAGKRREGRVAGKTREGRGEWSSVLECWLSG